MKPPQQLHIPVLLTDTVDLLNPKKNETYLDLTAGYGGHARAIVSHTGTADLATLVDRDAFAISQLQHFANDGARLIRADFLTFVKKAVETGEHFDMILLDLGVSSVQLDTADRGFSFRESAVLDMRMDQSQALTAADVVNEFSESDLGKIIREYGEEKPAIATKIARAIVMARADKPIETTAELADVIAQANPIFYGKNHHRQGKKIHPATRTFQAIRIAVNDELGQLEQTLPLLLQLLNDGGRLVIISFHSLEDRLVKNFLRDNDVAIDITKPLEILTKKPISGHANDVTNSRARSAKLRAARKITREIR
jgi:16S rRNA (cytosine1402-N4)-methyltransferase